MGMAVLSFLPCVLTHFSLLRPHYLCLSLLFPPWVQPGPSASLTLYHWEWKRGESPAPTDEFHFQSPGCLAKRQSNSQRHLLPPHPDAQLTWAWQALIYGGWAWLTMFFQNSYIGFSMKNSHQQQPKLGWTKSSMWTRTGERFCQCRLCCPKRLCIYNCRKSSSTTLEVCGDRHLPVEIRTDTGIKTGDFWCVKPDCQCLPQTDSCCSKGIQGFSCLPLFKNNTCPKLPKSKKCQC